MQLNEEFVKRMSSQLGDGLQDFLNSLEEPPVRSFHVNTAALSPEDFEKLAPAGFCETLYPGAFVCNDEHPGHHPLHHAGAVYMQDPAAMLVLSGIELKSGMRVLDLCAAPGGKTSQLASKLKGSGILIANEPHPGRNKILISNMERMGYTNVCITRSEPSGLSLLYPEYFDLILVDAPCSGEGMFRKYSEAVEQWSPENIKNCALRQKEILRSAESMLKPGGRLIYSTCTWAPEEDEEQLEYLLSLGLIPDEAPAIVKELALETVPGAYKCYPHLFKGEGQFMTYLRKPGELSENKGSALPAGVRPAKASCLEEAGCSDTSLPVYEMDGRIFLMSGLPEALPEECLPGVTLLQAGYDRKKPVPHHHFFSAYGNRLKNRLELDPADPDVLKYLSGWELQAPADMSKGYTSVCLGPIPMGGARCAGGRLKNLYPKGLRNP